MPELNYDLIPTNRLPAEERCLRDPRYRALVEMIYSQIVSAAYTPTELREAVIIAATKYEMRHCRPMVFGGDEELSKFLHSALPAGTE